MTDRSKFYVADGVDIEAIKDNDQRERVASLILAMNHGEISLQTLLQRYSSSVKGEKVLNNDYWDIPIVLLEMIGSPNREEVNASISELLDHIDNIEAKLRNHRHDTTKTYSAKPEF
mgnify:CR=1 FL=1